MSRRIDRSLAAAGLPPLERSAWVEVDIDQLITNAGALVALAEPAAVAAVVKADGYGHGLEMAARCAVAGGASWLCVADSAEALRLRRDGYEGRVFVLYPVPTMVGETMAHMGIDVTVGGLGEADDLSNHLGDDAPPLSVHVEIDTGMTRGGVPSQRALEVALRVSRGRRTRLAGVWTHLAAPEDNEATRSQLGRFDEALERLASAGIDHGAVHVAASAGLLSVDTSRHDLVRPGLAFYGLHPDAGDPLPAEVEPALGVKAHAVRNATVAPGTSVGYAGTWTASRESRIATLPIGYADGWSRSSSPGGSVLTGGERAPLVGRVSSDSLTVDVTGIEAVDDDSEFTLIGRDGDDTVSAAEVARVRDTISWEVLQQLGTRLSRVYISGGKPIALRPEASTRIVAIDGARLPRYGPPLVGDETGS